MKAPKGKGGRLLYIIGFFVIASLIYGIFISPFENNAKDKLLEQVQPTATPEAVSVRTYTEAPTDAPAATVYVTNTPAPTETPTPAPTDTPAPTEPPTLRQGDKGEAVKALQTRLINLGYLSGNADGDFGKKTTQAVKDFQVCNGLKEDGIFGPDCWQKITGYYCVSQMTVYVSSKGVYHTRQNCSGMTKSTKMQLSDAIRKGHRAHSGGCR